MEKASTAHHFPFLLIFLLTKHSSQVLRPVNSINAQPMVSFFIINSIETSRKSPEILPENGGISAANLWPKFSACARQWDSGRVTAIDENMMGNVGRGIHHNAAISLGKVRGMYIEGSDVDNGCILVMKARFEIDGDGNDSLRFFGVLHQRDLIEFQVTVIGGSGRYAGANGFAVVKAVGGAGGGGEKKLMFNVYLN